MNLDKANLLLVKYDDGDLYLISSSFFAREKFYPFGSPEIGLLTNGVLPIVLKAAEATSSHESVPTSEILNPVVHVVNLGTQVEITDDGSGTDLVGEIEVTVLLGRSDDPTSFTVNARSLKPSRVKTLSSGGATRPIKE